MPAVWRRACAAVALGLLAASPARADQTYFSNGIFSRSGLSVWASGPAFVLDTGNRFLGEQWDFGKLAGGIAETCFFGLGCLKVGAAIGGHTDGKLGIDYSLRVDSGSFGVLYPGASSITVPGAVPVDPSTGLPGPVTLGTGFAGLPSLPTDNRGGTARSTLQVTGPTLQASLGLEARTNAFAGATVCVVVGCGGPAFGPYGFDNSQDLLKVNPNNDGTLTVLGTTVAADQNVSGLGGLVNASVRLPDLDSSSAATPGGFDAGLLTAAKRDTVAAVNANIAQIAADAFHLPIPLSGNVGPFGYDLLQSNAGVALGLAQQLTFEPAATGKLLFSAPVTPVVGGARGAPTREVDFNYGDDVSFLPGSLKSVSVTPVTELSGELRNTTDLVVGGDINVRALGVDIAGVTLGPLVDASLPPVDLGRVNLVDQRFRDRIDAVAGQPITLDFACGGETGGGEFRSRDVCASSRYVDLGPAIAVGNLLLDRYNREECGAYSYQLGYPDPGPSCTSVFDHLGSPYVNTPAGRVDVSSLAPFRFVPLDPGPSATDETDAALLSSLGYVAGPPSFVIPQGAPLESFAVAVPEPGSLALLGTALLGFCVARRRKAG